MKANQPIGFFDSGIGGLTVANAVLTALPNEQIIYYGDSLHFPYGEKSAQEIESYALRISDFLLEKECKCIIIACNTASASAFGAVKEKVGNRAMVVNVIEPTIYYIQKHLSWLTSLGIIATRGTINSGAYQRQIEESIATIQTQNLATPLLAPMIEEGFINDEVSEAVIKKYLSHKALEHIEALVLACTHYPLIKTEIEQFYEYKVSVIDTPTVVAEYLIDVLDKENLLNETGQSRERHQFYVSQYNKTIDTNVNRFFNHDFELQELSIFG